MLFQEQAQAHPPSVAVRHTTLYNLGACLVSHCSHHFRPDSILPHPILPPSLSIICFIDHSAHSPFAQEQTALSIGWAYRKKRRAKMTLNKNIKVLIVGAGISSFSVLYNLNRKPTWSQRWKGPIYIND